MNTDLMNQLGGAVREARNAAKMTQCMLSEQTGIAQADISRIENGSGNPSLRTLARVAEGLGMKLELRLLEQTA